MAERPDSTDNMLLSAGADLLSVDAEDCRPYISAGPIQLVKRPCDNWLERFFVLPFPLLMRVGGIFLFYKENNHGTLVCM